MLCARTHCWGGGSLIVPRRFNIIIVRIMMKAPSSSLSRTAPLLLPCPERHQVVPFGTRKGVVLLEVQVVLGGSGWFMAHHKVLLRTL